VELDQYTITNESNGFVFVVSLLKESIEPELHIIYAL
jgi:hypothetical protein